LNWIESDEVFVIGLDQSHFYQKVLAWLVCLDLEIYAIVTSLVLGMMNDELGMMNE
jgi:hypothetical protein